MVLACKMVHFCVSEYALFLLARILQVVKETWGARGKRLTDYTLYTGTLGTAFLLFKAYQITKDKKDLLLSSEII